MQHEYITAFELLMAADEAFRLCQAELLRLVDNVALLQLDLVW